MASKWYLIRNRKKYGPYTSDHIKRLGEEGKLQRTDLLWKEGMKEPKAVGLAKGLSHVSIGRSSTQTAATVLDQQREVSNPVSLAYAFFTQSWNSASRRASLVAEYSRLANLTLPALYRELGKAVYERREEAAKYSDTYSRLDAVATEAAPQAANEPHAATSLQEQARALAVKGVAFAKRKHAYAQQQVMFGDLGRVVYQDQRVNKGLDLTSYATVSDQIAECHRRLEEIRTEQDTQIRSAVYPAPQARFSRAAVSGVSAALVVLVVGYLLLLQASHLEEARSVPKKSPLSPPTQSDADVLMAELRVATEDVSGVSQRSDRVARANRANTPRRTVKPDVQRKESPGTSQSAERTNADLQMAEALIKDLLQEQKLLPLVGDNLIGLLPPLPRLRVKCAVHENPRKVLSVATDSISTISVFESVNAVQINDVIYGWPSLQRLAADASATDPASLTFFSEIARMAGQYADFEKTRRSEVLPNHFRRMAAEGRIFGGTVIEMSGGILGVVERYGETLGVDQRSSIPTVLFWNAEPRQPKLIDAFPMAMASKDSRDDGHLRNVVDACSFGDKLVLLTASFHHHVPRTGQRLELWDKGGFRGSMSVEKRQGNNEPEYPRRVSVDSKREVAAILYDNSLSMVDVSLLNQRDMSLTERAAIVFAKGLPKGHSNKPRIQWTKPGGYCLVQRIRATEPGQGEIAIELYDETAKVVGQVGGEHAGQVGDIAEDGDSVALVRKYVPREGFVCAVEEPHEIELYSLPEFDSVGRVYTCFARHVYILADGTVISCGISDPDSRYMSKGAWDNQVINKRIGGHFATRWDLRKNAAIWRIRDVDIEYGLPVAGGRYMVTTRRKLGEVDAAVCLWDCDSREVSNDWVDEFAAMRSEVVGDELERRGRITLPAGPVDVSRIDEIPVGTSYSDVKRRLGGAGTLRARVRSDGEKPVVEASVDYELSGTERSCVRLRFESAGMRTGLLVENQLLLVGREEVN